MGKEKVETLLLTNLGPKGRSYKRNSSRSNGDWNVDKAKRQKAKDKRDKTSNSRDGQTKPSLVRSKSSQISSLKSQDLAKNNQNNTN